MLNKKSFAALLLCYIIWGMQPLYWTLLGDFDSMFILCARIVMSMVFTWGYLICTGRVKEIFAALKNPRLMKFLAPAAVFLCLDWGLFIVAVTNGHVLDATLGYYMNPMVIFLIGLFVFRERGDVLEYIAVGVAFAGVVFSAVQYGSFPTVSLCFAIIWPVYASIKKGAAADPIVSIAVETALMVPFAVVCSLVACRGEGGFASVAWGSVPALIGSGIVTALPMILYTYTVNDLPFKVVGIMQYAGTTITFVCGALFMNEAVTGSKLIMFAFIWVGLVIFTVGSFRRHRAGLKAGK